MQKKEATIIGAGLVGSLLAIYLLKRGYKVAVYERRPDMRKAGGSAGRSINLALSDRGILALEKAGVMDSIRKIAIPMHGRKMHFVDGNEVFQPYGKEGQFINSCSRGELNKMLVEEAEKLGALFFFNLRCDRVDREKKHVHFAGTGDELLTVHFDLLFGTDGSYSAARLNFQLQHDRFNYEQYYIDYGYKELHIPAGEDGTFQLDKNALHIWPRGNYMMIALPNTDGSFTCTLFFPFEGEVSFASLTAPEKTADFFRENFPDAEKLMPGILDDFAANPTSSLVTVKCFPWSRDGNFLLLGDASHAIVPFFGQGMNAGFEDCRVLDELMEKFEHDWPRVMHEFETLRKPDADAIAELAVNNFTEMRDKVADKKFLLQKKIEAAFSEKYPDKWIPAYSLVTFSPQVRYSEALARGRAQQEIMDAVMELPGIENIFSSNEVEQMMLERSASLTPLQQKIT